MRTRVLGTLVLTAVLALSGACGDDDDDEAAPTNDTSAQTTLEGGGVEEGVKLAANLVGASAEVPDPGDPDGAGSATVTLDESGGEVCYDITVQNIATPSAAHIHEGGPQVAGDIVVTFDPEKIGQGEDCVSAEADVIGRIKANPRGFYVNVHNADFPGGAVRGNLDIT
jgi:hypothetical protein